MKKRAEDTGLFKKCAIGVVGDILLDHYICGQVHRMSPEAPVPLVWVSGDSYAPGGAANTARNMATLGANVFLCGEIGKDGASDIVMKELKKSGVVTQGIICNGARQTSEKIRIVAQEGQLLRMDRETPGDISRATEIALARYVRLHMPRWDAVVVSDYAKGGITGALAKKILACARRYKKPVIVDTKPHHFSFFTKATVITPNKKEALETAKLFGERSANITRVGRILERVSGSAIMLTQGEKGLTLFESGVSTHFGSVARKDANVVGAGDTVVAALAIALASGFTIKESARLANIAAGIVVEKEGTATVTDTELQVACNAQK